jgi:hypothetical protein
MSIPSQYEYEMREFHEFQRQMREAETNPSRKADCAHFAQQMAADPGLIAERIGWLIDGSYGYGAMQKAKQVLGMSARANKAAQLTHMIGALEWRCPPRMTIVAWKKLTPAQKKALDRAVKKEIASAEKAEV